MQPMKFGEDRTMNGEVISDLFGHQKVALSACVSLVICMHSGWSPRADCEVWLSLDNVWRSYK